MKRLLPLVPLLFSVLVVFGTVVLEIGSNSDEAAALLISAVVCLPLYGWLQTRYARSNR